MKATLTIEFLLNYMNAQEVGSHNCLQIQPWDYFLRLYLNLFKSSKLLKAGDVLPLFIKTGLCKWPQIR